VLESSRPERLAFVLGTSPGRRVGIFLAELLHDPCGVSCSIGICGQKKTLGCYRLVPIASQSVEIAGLECSLYDLLTNTIPFSRGLTGPLSVPVPLIRILPRNGDSLTLVGNGKISAAVQLWSRVDAQTNASISSVLPYFTDDKIGDWQLQPKMLSEHFYDMCSGLDESSIFALKQAYRWAIQWKRGAASIELGRGCTGCSEHVNLAAVS
jgi:hypothetical protein